MYVLHVEYSIFAKYEVSGRSIPAQCYIFRKLKMHVNTFYSLKIPKRNIDTGSVSLWQETRYYLRKIKWPWWCNLISGPYIRDTVYPKKYAHGFVVLCFVVVMQSFIMNSHEVFIHIHQDCFAGTGAIVRLPQCQWSKPDGYGKISQCITTTKHSKAKTVCIFLGIYCICSTVLWYDMQWLLPFYLGNIKELCYVFQLQVYVNKHAKCMWYTNWTPSCHTRVIFQRRCKGYQYQSY